MGTLSSELRAEPPAAFAQLTDKQQQQLADALADARHRQAAELDAAVERGLSFVPRLLRGPVKKLLL